MNEINQKQSIKVDFKFSREIIEFLDTLMFIMYIDSNSRLQTTLHKNQLTIETINMLNRYTHSHLK